MDKDWLDGAKFAFLKKMMDQALGPICPNGHAVFMVIVEPVNAQRLELGNHIYMVSDILDVRTIKELLDSCRERLNSPLPPGTVATPPVTH